MVKPVWKYVGAAHVKNGTLTDKLIWCKQAFGPYGHAWSVSYATSQYRFQFKQREHCVMFDLAWANE
jgi:hypothetical protein